MFDLKLFRKVNKMSQIAAAKYFGCDQSFISQIETNLRSIPDTFISKILADSNIILPEGIITEIQETATCKLCAEKDRTIKALELSIALLRDKISNLEKAAGASNSNYSQTA